MTILEGESLVNDATALVTYRFAVAATLTGVFSVGDAAADFVTRRDRRRRHRARRRVGRQFVLARLDDPPVEVLVSLIAPFAAYLPAEVLHVSGVLAAVDGRPAPRLAGTPDR